MNPAVNKNSDVSGLIPMSSTPAPSTIKHTQNESVSDIGKTLLTGVSSNAHDINPTKSKVTHSDGSESDESKKTSNAWILNEFKKIGHFTERNVKEFFKSNPMNNDQKLTVLKHLYETEKNNIDDQCDGYDDLGVFSSIYQLEGNVSQFFSHIFTVKDVLFRDIKNLIQTALRADRYTFYNMNTSEELFKNILNSDYNNTEILTLLQTFPIKQDEGVFSKFVLNNVDFLTNQIGRDKLNLFLAHAEATEPDFHQNLYNLCLEKYPDVAVGLYASLPVHYSVEERLELAKRSTNTTAFAQNILQLFSDEEILEHKDLIVELFHQSKNHTTDQEIRSYLDNTEQHIAHVVKMASSEVSQSDSDETLPEVYQTLRTFTDAEGNSFRLFRVDDAYREESPRKSLAADTPSATIQNKNIELFPAIVREPSRLRKTFSENPAFSKLGFKLETGANGIFVTFPEPETLVKKWNEFRQAESMKNPPRLLPELKLVPVDGLVSVEEFNIVFRQGGLVVDLKGEYFHDMSVHVLSTIECMLNSVSGSYEESLQKAIDQHTNAQLAIDAAKSKNPDESTTKLLNVMSITTGVFADLLTAMDNVDELKKTTEETFGRADPDGTVHYEDINFVKTSWEFQGWITKYSDELEFLRGNEDVGGVLNNYWIKVLQDYKAG